MQQAVEEATFTAAALDLAEQGRTAVVRTMLTSKAFRDPANIGRKFKTPFQYVISVARVSGFDPRNAASTDDVAQTYVWIAEQPKSAWSNEIELRPFTEDWTF